MGKRTLTATIDKNEAKKKIEAALAAARAEIPAGEEHQLDHILDQVLVEGVTVREALEIPQPFIDKIYERGYSLFRSGKYKEAAVCFLFLTRLDPRDLRATFALAASHHKMGHYFAAINYYYTCCALDEKNPIPAYHLVDCFLKTDQLPLALGALVVAFDMAGETPMYAKLKKSMEVEFQALMRSY